MIEPAQTGSGTPRLAHPRIDLVRMHLVALRQVCHRPSAVSFFVITPSVYQTERPFSNLASGPKIGVHFKGP